MAQQKIVRVKSPKKGDDPLNERQQYDRDRLITFLEYVSPYLKEWIYQSSLYGVRVDASISVRRRDNSVECKSDSSVSDVFDFQEYSWKKDLQEQGDNRQSEVVAEHRYQKAYEIVAQTFHENRSWLFNDDIQQEHNRLKLIIRSGNLVYIVFEMAKRVLED